MSKERRHKSVQELLTRMEYTENNIQPLIIGDGQVQLDSNAVANLILHTVLNQLTIMSTLKELLLKDGETVMRVEENPE
jgi:hypothetical protein